MGNRTMAVIRSPTTTAFAKFRKSLTEIYRGIMLLTRYTRKAIRDAASEIRAKLSATIIPSAETKSTSRRYKAANGEVAARVTSTAERRTLRFARDDGSPITTR